MLLVTQIDTFYYGLTLSHRDTINAAAAGTFMRKTPEECCELIKNMTAHHNHWDTSAIRDEPSRNISSNSTTERRGNNFNQAPTYQAPTHQPQVATQVDFQAYTKANDAVMKNMQTQMTSLTHSNLELKNMFGQFMKMNTASSLGTGSIPSNIVPNLREDLKAITTQSGVTLVGPSVSPPSSKEVDREPETITDQKFLEKLGDPATTSVNENCSAVIWKKFLEKLGDPGKTKQALIDVYGEELTLCVDDEAITFKVCQTSKYSYNDAESINRVDVIDVACEEYVQEVLGFFDNPNLWVSPVHCVPKKGGMTVVENEDNELIPTRCMMAIFHDMIEETMEVFMDDFSVFEDSFFSCLSNLDKMLKRCMMAIFHDMIEKMMEVFMDDFLIFDDSFSSCLSHLDKMLQRCEDTTLIINWEKCHFMVKEGIVHGRKISKSEIEVDRAKVDVIAKHPLNKDSRVRIDLIKGQGKWRVKMKVLSSLTTKAQLAQHFILYSSINRIICDLNKTPDLSLQSLQNCPKCGNPVDGDCNTPKLARSGILGSGRATSWINNT
nr:hypothetical protein [Tanacetum cinerariifolium]